MVGTDKERKPRNPPDSGQHICQALSLVKAALHKARIRDGHRNKQVGVPQARWIGPLFSKEMLFRQPLRLDLCEALAVVYINF
ncbi:hypothetical protein D3C80_1678830 [compost metagenome]